MHLQPARAPPRPVPINVVPGRADRQAPRDLSLASGGLPLAAVLGVQAFRRRLGRKGRLPGLRARGGEAGALVETRLSEEEVWRLQQVAGGLSQQQERARDEILQQWGGASPVLLQGPAGTGKARVMGAVAAAAGLPVLVLSRSKEGARRLHKALQAAGLPAELLASALEGVPGYVDEEAEQLRGRALAGLASRERPVVVATAAALCPGLVGEATPQEVAVACELISRDLEQRVEELQREGMAEAAGRLTSVVGQDLCSLREGKDLRPLRKYTEYLPERLLASPLEVLMRRFGRDWALMAHECQLPAASAARRQKRLVEQGFVLPSALARQPPCMEELLSSASRRLLVSEKPEDFRRLGLGPLPLVRMLLRPTHIPDAEVVFEKMGEGFHEGMLQRIKGNRSRGQQSLVACGTAMEADLLALRAHRDFGLKAEAVHGQLALQDRRLALEAFRQGGLDVLFGVHLTREGTDLPAASLVYVLDAESSAGCLPQLVGQAAQGKAVLAFRTRPSRQMRECRRSAEQQRGEQRAFNAAHGLLPLPQQRACAPSAPRRPLSPRLKVAEEELQKLQELLQQEVQAGRRLQRMLESRLHALSDEKELLPA